MDTGRKDKKSDSDMKASEVRGFLDVAFLWWTIR